MWALLSVNLLEVRPCFLLLCPLSRFAEKSCSHARILIGTEIAKNITAAFVFIFIEIELIHNVVLVSGVLQSDSDIHIYMYFLHFLSL